jgi:ribonuclease HII
MTIIETSLCVTAGVDEAGRGPLAGPVVAAAVILDIKNPITGLADSKTLSAKKRDILFEEIMALALCVSIGQASAQEIDEINILHATMRAMQRAVHGLRLSPTLVLIDGNRSPELAFRTEAIIKGDKKIAEISAASIIAKVTRDRWCHAIHKTFPNYNFDKHKGYGTKDHLEVLRLYGPCPEHRHSFRPVRDSLR